MIKFEEKSHTYTNESTNQRYISVTTLIHKYVPEFDEFYWSSYKAIKDILESYNMWRVYKSSCGGWENVVNSWLKKPIGKYKEEVELKRQSYIAQWADKRENACDIGTAEHKRRELKTSQTPLIRYDGVDYETCSNIDILAAQDFTTNRIYTELLVYNHEHRIAGQIDKVRKIGNRVWISDYKTNEEITKSAFRDEVLKAPLNDLPNANWYIYDLQLSFYGWLLEKRGYIVSGLELHHTRTDELYQMPYLKSHIDRLVNDYNQF
jgi:ATP-dependent exoDNAse (exonuclease V) beta subunit